MASLLRMPEISANTAEAILADWPLSENATFAAGDPIATVETEKAVVDVPAEADGVLLRTLIEPGKAVPVGTPLAVLGAPGEAVDDLDGLVEKLTGTAPPSAINDNAKDEPSPAGTREVSQAAGDSATAGSGDGVAAAAEAETRAGTDAAGNGPARGHTPETGSGATGEVGTAGGEMAGAGEAGRIFASPLARRLARENGLSIADIRGTGPGGRIVRDDVRRAAVASRNGAASEPAASQSASSQGAMSEGVASEGAAVEQEAARVAATFARTSPTSAPASPTAAGQPGSPPAASTDRAAPASAVGGREEAERTGYEDIPHTRMRRAIANRLAESSREAPVFSIRGSARVDALLALRKELNAAAGVKISVNDLIVAAAARAHVAVPEMNVIWTADTVRRFRDVDIAVAVATDTGLVTPVVRDVANLTVSALAARGADFVARARAGRLRQDELEGGTLTVTNLGPFGTEDFTAVINPPQAAILAVGAARQEAVVTDGELGIATVLRVTLSVDHRPVDGATGARWMAAFLALLEAPLRILV